MARDKICTPFLALASPENKFTVSTIEDMQSRKYLKIGDVVELNGYYTAGDGAGHKRKIEARKNNIFSVVLANGLWANLIDNDDFEDIIMSKTDVYRPSNFIGKYPYFDNRRYSVSKTENGFSLAIDEEAIFGTTSLTVYISELSTSASDGKNPLKPITFKRFKANMTSGVYGDYSRVNINVKLMDKFYKYDALPGLLENRKIRITGLNSGSWITSGFFVGDVVNSTDVTTNITTISGVDVATIGNVYDFGDLDVYGIPRIYKKVNSIDEMVDGSWFASGSTLQIKQFNYKSMDTASKEILITTKLGDGIGFRNECAFLKNVNFAINTGSSSRGSLDISSDFFIYLKNCKIIGGNADALRINGAGYTVISEDVICAYGGKDGFNYHTTSKSSKAIEVNCVAFGSGLYKVPYGNQTTHSNNATTCHDGMSVYRFGTVGFDCEGGVLADVGGCESVNYNCIMSNSSSTSTKANYLYRNENNDSTKNFVMIDCISLKENQLSIDCDSKTNLVIENFKGNINKFSSSIDFSKIKKPEVY